MSAQLAGTYNLSPPSGARAATEADAEFFGSLEELSAAGARGMVEAQQALDEQGRARLLIRETYKFKVPSCRFKVKNECAFNFEPATYFSLRRAA